MDEYRVFGKIEYSVPHGCDCEYCDHYTHKRRSVNFEVKASDLDSVVVLANTKIVNKFELYEEDDFEWLDGPFVEEITEERFMQRMSAPTLFDLEQIR